MIKLRNVKKLCYICLSNVMTNGMRLRIIYFLIYWVASGIILVALKSFEDVNKKLKLKDWLPTFILAPITFPFHLTGAHFRHRGYFSTGPKKKNAEKAKSEKR